MQGSAGRQSISIATLAALEHRRRTGEGQLIEVAQIEVAACVAAEPVIEYSMNANAQPREGNRSRGHVQGVYPTAVDDAWVALCVRDDADWAHMVEAMGRSDLLRDARFASAEQRRLAHDEFDGCGRRLDADPNAVGNHQYP